MFLFGASGAVFEYVSGLFFSPWLSVKMPQEAEGAGSGLLNNAARCWAAAAAGVDQEKAAESLGLL